jgi:hypothetical protein
MNGTKWGAMFCACGWMLCQRLWITERKACFLGISGGRKQNYIRATWKGDQIPFPMNVLVSLM